MSGFRSEGLGQAVSDRERRWQSYLGGIALGKAESLLRFMSESAASLLGLALRIDEESKRMQRRSFSMSSEQVWRTAYSFDPRAGVFGAGLTVLVRSRALDRLRTASAKRDRAQLPLVEDWELVSREPLPDSTTIFNQERILIQSALRFFQGNSAKRWN